MELIKSVLTVISLFSLVNGVLSGKWDVVEQPCDNMIYCQGKLLHTVNMRAGYKDSKSFVDRPLIHAPEQVLANFELFMRQYNDDPSKEQVIAFVDDNFEPNSTEFNEWQPDDWHPNPEFFNKIADPAYKTWARALHLFWYQLGRNITDDVRDRPEYYSMIYVPHPVIVPGGRFKEFYYWDSYWIQEGLLLSEMNKTVKGMIRNFVYMVDELGFVPNGGRIYFRRSQPPFLIPMVKNYLDVTQDYAFLDEILPTLDKEFDFWIQNRMVTVRHQNRDYRMARYNSNKGAPRPESYREDYELAADLPTQAEKEELYFNLHAGAESGWDYSSKWFMVPPDSDDEKNLKYIKTRHIIPAELNALLFYNAKLMAEFYGRTRSSKKVAYYQNAANSFQEAINDVLWDEDQGCWFDYNLLTNTLGSEFYPTNIVPLWAGVQKTDAVVGRVLEYLQTKSGATSFLSGVPSSLQPTGEQWDFPNGWAPSQSMIIQALERTNDADAKELAYQLAEKWIRTNFKSFYLSEPNHMYEKYDVTVDGQPGGGGEYDVVIGFGWTNGVVFDFLNTYGDRLRAPTKDEVKRMGSDASRIPGSIIPISIVLVCAFLTGTIWG